MKNKKRLSKDMRKLIEMSKNNSEYSQRYIDLAREISIKHRIRFPKEAKILVCRRCGSFIYPGKDSRVRVRDGKVTYFCKKCKNFRRIPYR